MISIITSSRCTEYGLPGHPERPERISKTIDYLKSQKNFSALEWIEARSAKREEIERVHPCSHYQLIESENFFDSDTPALPHILKYALLSAGAAIQAAELALKGIKAFSLMRPPGHHCSRDQLMGFCYFNNIAIAIEALRSQAPGAAKQIAIFDFDCHHGNGTEAIYEGDPDTLFVSLHQSPCYPGTGLISQANTLNYPLPPHTLPAEFLKICRIAIDEIDKFQPQVIAISAGFDSYKEDPITQMSLEIDTFHELGQRLAKMDIPSFAILEGGYAEELPLCIAAFLEGWGK